MATISLPKLIVIKSKPYSDKGHAYFKADGASVLVGEEDIFSTLVKIEVERSTTNTKYVNLKFGYFNRYWRRKENEKFIVAESDQPEEDVKEAACTLFEPVKVDDAGVFYLRHVQSGGRVSVDGSTLAFYVNESSGDADKSYLTFVDWSTLVKLPAKAAFKGDNGKYLTTYAMPMFELEDPNDEKAIFTVEMKPDGYVRITAPDVAYEGYEGSSLVVNTNRPDLWLMFDKVELNKLWVVKIDENSIALRSTFNNYFCRMRYESYAYNFLSADSPTIKKEAMIKVEEPVLGRKIYNVVYQMEYARIFDEKPYVAGSSTLINDKDEAASMQASVTYTDERSYTFSRTLSMTAGVSSTIEAGVPFISKASITVSYEINGAFQWDETTTTTTSITGTAMVPVPGKTSVTLDFVGTRGTCNIPYYYTQEDKSSADGQISYTDHVDGTYTGVNYYNFNFHVRETKSL